MTVTEVTTLLSRYAGANNTFLERLNLVRARLLSQGNWPDTLRILEISVTEDASTGYSVVVLPAGYSTILAGTLKPTDATNPWCGGIPLGVRNVFDWFNKAGMGYGSAPADFQELAPDGSNTKRYRVPTCYDGDYEYVVLAKVGYVALTQGSDTVTPNNVGAIKAGLQALLAEDADNRGLSRELWAEAMALLAEQAENETGPGASGVVEIRDDLNLCMIGTGL